MSPTIKDRHIAYLCVCSMPLPMSLKTRCLNEVISFHEGAWEVVGITPAALQTFAAHNFKKESGMGINRAHLRDRHETYTEMLTHPMHDVDEWWDFYTSNDRTVFSTVDENFGGLNEDEIIWFDFSDSSRPEKLFKTSGFAWRHTKQEIAFLQNIYENIEKK